MRMQATHAFLSCSIAFDAFVEMHVKNDENTVPEQDTSCSTFPWLVNAFPIRLHPREETEDRRDEA